MCYSFFSEFLLPYILFSSFHHSVFLPVAGLPLQRASLPLLALFSFTFSIFECKSWTCDSHWGLFNMDIAKSRAAFVLRLCPCLLWHTNSTAKEYPRWSPTDQTLCDPSCCSSVLRLFLLKGRILNYSRPAVRTAFCSAVFLQSKEYHELS